MIEKVGFDSIWLSDVQFEGGPDLILPDIFPLMTALGLDTRRCILGTVVIDGLFRHPGKIATTTATIDNMLNGRTIFGIGGGETINHEPFGVPTTDVYAKLRETVQIVKLLWTADAENPASFQGRYYSLKEAYLKIRPKSKPHPPLYLPAFGPKMLAMVGELADGWLPFNHTVESYQAFLNGPVKSAADKANRSLDDLDRGNIFVTAVSKERNDAEQAVKNEVKTWLTWSPDILRMIAPQLKHPSKRQPYIKSRFKEDVEAQNRLAKEIPDEVALKVALWGTPDDCIDRLESFFDAGLSHPILVFVPTAKESVEKMIKSFASKVIPYFKSKRT